LIECIGPRSGEATLSGLENDQHLNALDFFPSSPVRKATYVILHDTSRKVPRIVSIFIYISLFASSMGFEERKIRFAPGFEIQANGLDVNKYGNRLFI
jgi:hypothetical protein